jgi:fructokinase
VAAAGYIGGVELGGTKSIAVVARGREIIDRCVVPTSTPGETLTALNGWLASRHAELGIAAIGIASFGPVRLDPAARDHGCILKTPKPGWSGAPVAAALVAGLDLPWRIDTDVNGAALAEWHWGAGRGCDALCYITVGTGVGGGLVINGAPVHGAMHPEIGHMRLRRAAGDGFAGACPFHGDCIEGLISGPALAQRFGTDPALVADGDARWTDVVHDLAQLAGAVLLATSARHILFGGGVMITRPLLLEAVRDLLVAELGPYLPFLTHESARTMIDGPALGSEAGPLGAVALGLAAQASEHRAAG